MVGVNSVVVRALYGCRFFGVWVVMIWLCCSIVFFLLCCLFGGCGVGSVWFYGSGWVFGVWFMDVGRGWLC